METQDAKTQYLQRDTNVNLNDYFKKQDKIKAGGLEGIEVRNTAKQLGKNDFLQLLVTQLSHQDPTAPIKDQQFIAQMAQFSSLEQMQNVASGIGQMVDRQAFSLVGKFVVGSDFATGGEVSGLVDAVFFDGAGATFLKVGGRAVRAGDVKLVGDPERFRAAALEAQSMGVPGAVPLPGSEQAAPSSVPAPTPEATQLPADENSKNDPKDESNTEGNSKKTDVQKTAPESGGSGYLDNQRKIETRTFEHAFTA